MYIYNLFAKTPRFQRGGVGEEKFQDSAAKNSEAVESLKYEKTVDFQSAEAYKRCMITTVVITKNNEDKIDKCLKSAKLLGGEILVIDGASIDKTVDIAEKYGPRVIKQKEGSYSTWRNQGIEKARGEWIFYLDSDEEMSEKLIQEIKNLLLPSAQSLVPSFSAYAIPRKNIIFGREMKHGGWWPDYVKRLFRKESLKKWVGDLHEEPVFDGELGHLKSAIIHHKHEHVSEMIEKTNKWSEIEAKLLFDVGHPKMSWWRFFRIIKTELFYRYIWKLGFLDGTAGAVYAIYQAFSRFVTYTKLWEMQKEEKVRQPE